jgi:hypothetical protein
MNKRFDELRKVPFDAAVDHRFFLDDAGHDSRLSKLPRKKRRQLAAEGRKLAEKYQRVQVDIARSGAGYPIDKLIRDFAVEYTHRYAASGVMNQPVSFNYFEAFCAIKLFKDTVAPYAEPRQELDHLFNVPDFFDYLTSENAPRFSLKDLLLLPEGVIHNFTQNGIVDEFTYLTAEGREFVISGFSIVRHENIVHWCVLGGEVLSNIEWKDRCDNQPLAKPEDILPRKRPFLADFVEQTNIGAPVALEGTSTAVRTIIAGETDLDLGEHTSRCYMTELDSGFMLLCDDPDIFSSMPDGSKRDSMIAEMRRRIESAAVMWNLAGAFFQLPGYFRFRLTVSRDVVHSSGLSAPRKPKGGRGIAARYKHVTALEISDHNNSVVRSYVSPHLPVHVEGFWRRLKPNEYGTGRNGESIVGRTWVNALNEWRARADEQRTIYVKSSVAAAGMRKLQYIEAAAATADANPPADHKTDVLYVMRYWQ